MENTNVRLFIALLIGILIGGGFGYQVFGTDSLQAGGAQGLDKEAVDLQEGDAKSAQRAAELQSVGSEALRALPAKAETVKVTDGDAARLLAESQAQAIDREEGDGVIVGKVVDTEGKPLEGVVVRLKGRSSSRATSSGQGTSGAAPELENLQETVRRAAQGYHDRKALRYQVTTSVRGEYRFEGLADRGWDLRAYLEGFEVKADSSARRVSIGTQVDFTAHAIHLLQVAVLMPNGSDAERALLSVHRLGRSQSSKNYKWSSDQAALRLSPGRYEVRAHSQSAASMKLEELASKIQIVVVEEGKELEALRLSLVPRLGIRGSVKAKGVSLASDNPVVLWQPLPPGHEVDLNALAGSDNEKWVELGDDFVLNDLAEGRYTIGVARSWKTPIVDHKVVAVNHGFAEVVLELPEIDRSKLISVTVLDPEGRPLLDVGFSMQTKRKGRSMSRGLNAGRSENGAYLIDLPAHFHTNYFEPKGEGMRFWLVAEFPEYGALEAELDRGQTQLTMKYSAPASLVVSAPGCAGSNYEGRLHIYLTRKMDAGRQNRSAPGDGDKFSGEYAWEWSGLSPGTYTVSLQLSRDTKGSMASGRSVSVVEVEIRPGENRLEVTVPTLYPLRVHWADAEVGDSLTLTRLNGELGEHRRFGSPTFDQFGIAEWKDLPPGRYMLSPGYPPGRMMEITVPSGEIEFTPMVINAAKVTVTDPACALAKAGIQTGDLLVGYDGELFEDQAELQLFLSTLVHRKTELEFKVRRGNRDLTITVPGAEIGRAGQWGVRLVPTAR